MGRERQAGEPAMLSVREAARFLGLDESTVRRYANDPQKGAFPRPIQYTPRGKWLFRRADLLVFIEGCRLGGGVRPGPVLDYARVAPPRRRNAR